MINRTKSSIYNMIASAMSIVINLFIGFILTKFVLNLYGSDYNGLNSTISQIINALLIVESGFAISANVALFKPIINNDFDKINSILSTVKHIFQKIAIIVLVLGIGCAFIFALIIKSNVNYWEIIALFCITLFPIVVRLFFIIKYTCYFEACQKEYIVNFISLICNVFNLIVCLIIIKMELSYLILRVSYMIFNLVNCLFLFLVFKKLFFKINFNLKSDLSLIKGTKDLLTQKLTGIIYSCLPYIVTSIVISSAETSVYGMYMLVFNSIKSLGQVVIQAPKNALGQLYAYDNKENCCQIFKKYNFFSISIISVLTSVTIILILPFITLYVKGVSDINYIRPVLCILLAIVTYLELIHIPSGLMINLSGAFAISKKIQLIATMVLLILGIPLINIFGLIGMVIAQLCCNLYLCFAEIYYAHRKVFKINLFECIKIIFIGIIYILTMFLIASYVQNLIIGSFTWITFIICGFFDLIIGIIIYMLFCIIFFRENFLYFINLFKKIIYKKINERKKYK